MADPTPAPTRWLSLLEERRHRRQSFTADRVQNAFVFLLLTVAEPVYVYNDFLLLRGSWVLYVALGSRILCSLLTLPLTVLLFLAKDPRRHDRLASWGLVATSVLIAVLTLTRLPTRTYLPTVITTSILLVIIFFVMRGPLWSRLFAATLMILPTVALIWNPQAAISTVTRNSATITLLSVGLLGALSARTFETQRRKRFQAEQKERKARRELALRLQELAAEKERTENMSRVRTAFLAAMSHEFRTPMNAVIGLSDLLLESRLSVTDKAHVQTISDSARALLSILNDILDFTKIDAQKLDLSPTPFDPSRLASSVIDLLRPTAAARSLAVTVVLSPELPDCLLGDEARLRQVLVNLVANAIKFTQRGGVQLTVEASAGDAADCDLMIRVEDTGIGMSSEVVARLFQPFEQAEAGTARRYGGSGLGLAISQRIIQAMGGAIQVASQPGRGSVFSFTLRLPRAQWPPQYSRASAVEQSGPSARLAERAPLSILVVDDQSLNREVAQAKLARFGYTAELAEDGPGAIAAVQRKEYDVVFMDLQMPGMSGLEATRRIFESLSASRPASRQPHVIALTASVFETDREACRKAGMIDFIGKPIENAQLDAVLTRVAIERAAPASPVAAAATLSVQGRQQLQQIEERGEPDFVARLSQIFLADTRKRLPRMGDAHQRGDAATLEYEAHILRSASATVGAQEMSALSGQIEEAARAGQLAEIGGWLATLDELLPRVEQALTSAGSTKTREDNRPPL